MHMPYLQVVSASLPSPKYYYGRLDFLDILSNLYENQNSKSFRPYLGNVPLDHAERRSDVCRAFGVADSERGEGDDQMGRQTGRWRGGASE